jgi:hypothetical protein
MIKANLLIGLLALVLFGTAQYQGWNLFQSAFMPNSLGRTYHK